MDNGLTNSFRSVSLHQTVYSRLHAIADRALRRERSGHCMQPAVLADDAYMQLLRQRNIDPLDAESCICAGNRIIRRLLIDDARKRKAAKRGGAQGRGGPLPSAIPDSSNAIELIELMDALQELSRHRSRAAMVVHLKFFDRLTNQEIADQLDVSIRTVKSDWRCAREWLRRELGNESVEPGCSAVD